MKGILKTFASVIMCLGLVSTCLAGSTSTAPITVKATVPQQSGLQVTISRINVPGDTWVPGVTSIDFGTLTYDSTYNIFRANCYYALDIGVTSNSLSWTITHTANSILRSGGTENLNNNVNVVFMKQTSDTSATQIAKVNYAASNGYTISKSQVSPGWLRIYYGIATGSGDASGVTPIGATTTPGTYQGSIVLTLTD
ncbi:MAG: hypothetical protein NC909_01010 [Candidatus Omnitrophica bacterium]|nr:hypothetical protein [Candidatus Omnitrophota bacterium]